ncbi:leucyl/phenylalanyl-tRNA--protein transferase [Ottowia testudinis]|uniref:Leucyl/phenylalanyl-tRNA--protein transferase n=1 Tax=Ottowia testudinis TaxID=2816950 RepID=A0A975CEG9_9BURK|nr:leucyl/phenylalanyl-tRNA--protein transferase [Ottowia testudinis]QTD44049.1 leucyl/phenylalanyl-tRNA--protein transferase [Ottowia testudinis]
MTARPSLALLQPGDAFPPLSQAWPARSPAPGLIAAGGTLDVPTLVAAYSATIFPWFSEGEPILWWSPDPRMVLPVTRFRLHRSLRRVVQAFRANASCEIRIDSAFEAVIAACAAARRPAQSGTWIGPEMQQAYAALHRAGHAHSVETWVDGRLVGGLYCVAIGRAVFGESMFTEVNDGSKIALTALVALCRAQGRPLIDCQQNTHHLAFMGAAEMPRAEFAAAVRQLAREPAAPWRFDPVYWDALMPRSPADR